jgi:hypothetical protein
MAASALGAELALDRLAAAVAAELPAHLRAVADARAAGARPPPAPAVLRDPAAMRTARRAAAFPPLAAGAAALARLAAPVAIESDPAVVTARALAPTWPALPGLARARSAASRAALGAPHAALVHALYGVAAAGARRAAAGPPAWTAVPPPVAGWATAAAEPGLADARSVWRELARVHGVGSGSAAVALIPTERGRPCAIVVDPGREVRVLIPAHVSSPAARFATMHELGHALAAVLVAAPLPRVVDEAVAAYAARALEDLAHPWFTPLAAAARARRAALTAALAAVEEAIAAAVDPPSSDRDPSVAEAAAAAGAAIGPAPPWPLWHDPAAQAAYASAEALADAWSQAPAAALATAIAAAARAADAITAAYLRGDGCTP